MKPFFGAAREIMVGEPAVVESDAADGSKGVVFEDDGDTGYFYARDYSQPHIPFVDAVHIYSVKGVIDKFEPSVIRIIWSPDWLRAALLVNDLPHAMMDFETKCGYCRDAFPEPDPNSGWKREGWRDELRNYFYPV